MPDLISLMPCWVQRSLIAWCIQQLSWDELFGIEKGWLDDLDQGKGRPGKMSQPACASCPQTQRTAGARPTPPVRRELIVSFGIRCLVGTTSAAVKRDGAYGGPSDVGRYEFGKVGGARPLGAAHLFPL